MRKAEPSCFSDILDWLLLPSGGQPRTPSLHEQDGFERRVSVSCGESASIYKYLSSRHSWQVWQHFGQNLATLVHLSIVPKLDNWIRQTCRLWHGCLWPSTLQDLKTDRFFKRIRYPSTLSVQIQDFPGISCSLEYNFLTSWEICINIGHWISLILGKRVHECAPKRMQHYARNIYD